MNSRPHIDISSASSRLKRFRNYCGLLRSARCGFLWEKTTKSSLASVHTDCETAVASLGNRFAHRQPRHGGELFTRLSVLLLLCALHVQCADAFAVARVLSGRAEPITTMVPVYTWDAPPVHSQNSLGTLTVTGSNQGSNVPLLNPSIRGKDGTLICSDARVGRFREAVEDYVCAGQMWVHVTVTLVSNADPFEAMVDAEQPVITGVETGPWASALQAQPVAVPYYTGHIWYLPKLTAYVNLWWDWRTTHATELNRTLARYRERADATLSKSQWRPGQAVSQGPLTVKIASAVADGVYSMRLGLYDTQTGSRVPLGGVDDGDMRYIVGDLTVSGNGSNISFNTALPGSDPRLSSPGTIVSFGTVQTDGMISIPEGHGQWVLRPFPRCRSFTVLLEKSKFVMPTSVRADGGSSSLLKPVAEGAYWKLPLTGAKSYSWPVAD